VAVVNCLSAVNCAEVSAYKSAHALWQREILQAILTIGNGQETGGRSSDE